MAPATDRRRHGQQSRVCGGRSRLWHRDHIGKYDVRHSGDCQTSTDTNSWDHQKPADRSDHPTEHIRRQQFTQRVMRARMPPKGGHPAQRELPGAEVAAAGADTSRVHQAECAEIRQPTVQRRSRRAVATAAAQRAARHSAGVQPGGRARTGCKCQRKTMVTAGGAVGMRDLGARVQRPPQGSGAPVPRRPVVARQPQGRVASALSCRPGGYQSGWLSSGGACRRHTITCGNAAGSPKPLRPRSTRVGAGARPAPTIPCRKAARRAGSVTPKHSAICVEAAHHSRDVLPPSQAASHAGGIPHQCPKDPQPTTGLPRTSSRRPYTHRPPLNMLSTGSAKADPRSNRPDDVCIAVLPSTRPAEHITGPQAPEPPRERVAQTQEAVHVAHPPTRRQTR